MDRGRHGGAGGRLVLAAAGYGLGLLMLAWFGGSGCCGLEGLFPVILGGLSGGALGLVSGALVGAALATGRRPGLRHVALVALVWSLLLAATWAFGNSVFRFSIEGTGDVAGFFAATLIAPVGVGVAAVLRSPAGR